MKQLLLRLFSRKKITKCDDFGALSGSVLGITPPPRKEWFANPILVTARGEFLDSAEGDVSALVTNSVRRAPGVKSATLDVFGFSAIVIERRLLDPGLAVTGVSSVAEILPNGRYRARRWFDPNDPL